MLRINVAALGVAAALLGGAPAVQAQDSIRRVTLDDAVALFARHSLELRIARAEAARGAARARQAAAYPNPVLGATHETLGGGGADADETYLLLSQELRWPWEASARGRAADAERDAGTHRVAADSLRLAFAMKQAYLEAAGAEAIRGGLAEATAVVRAALEDAARREAEGDLSGYALRRLRVERVRYETELSAADLAVRAARGRLGVFLFPDSTVTIAPAGLPTGTPPDSGPWRSAPRGGGVPAVAAAQASLDAARAEETAVGRGRLPALAATGGYKTQSDGLTGVFLGLSLPLPLFDRRGAAAREAGAATAQAEAYLALVRRQAENDRRLAVAAYEAARARARLLEDELLAEPDVLLRVARVAYTEGEMSLVELLDAVDAYRVARVTAAEARRDLWISYFDLERAGGGWPARVGGAQ